MELIDLNMTILKTISNLKLLQENKLILISNYF